MIEEINQIIDEQKLADKLVKKIEKIIEIYPSYNYKKINNKISLNIPLDNDSIKGFLHNKKKFYNLYDKVIETKFSYLNEELQIDSFYKLCHITGLFNTSLERQDLIISFINEFCTFYDISVINNIFNNINLKKYNSKLKNLIINNYKNDCFKETFYKIYNNYDYILDYIKNKKEEEIKKLKTKKDIVNAYKSMKNIDFDEFLNYLDI